MSDLKYNNLEKFSCRLDKIEEVIEYLMNKINGIYLNSPTNVDSDVDCNKVKGTV